MPDRLLASLVAAVEQRRLTGLIVTLSTTGGIVSGELISSATYLAELARRLAVVGADESSAIGLLSLAELTDAPGIAEAIHLFDATTVAGGTLVRLPLWRGSVTAVAGWAPGHLHAA